MQCLIDYPNLEGVFLLRVHVSESLLRVSCLSQPSDGTFYSIPCIRPRERQWAFERRLQFKPKHFRHQIFTHLYRPFITALIRWISAGSSRIIYVTSFFIPQQIQEATKHPVGLVSFLSALQGMPSSSYREGKQTSHSSPFSLQKPPGSRKSLGKSLEGTMKEERKISKTIPRSRE